MRYLPGRLKPTTNCMVCKKELPIRFPTDVNYEESDLENAIKNDDCEELFFMMKQFTFDGRLYSKIFELGMQYSSYKILRKLKTVTIFNWIDFEVTRRVFISY